jgi:hypothetical protein
MVLKIYPEVPCLLSECLAPAILAPKSVVEVVLHHFRIRDPPTESPRDVVEECPIESPEALLDASGVLQDGDAGVVRKDAFGGAPMGTGGIQRLITQPKGEAQRDDKKDDEEVRPACALESNLPRARHEKTSPGKWKVLYGKQSRQRKLGAWK